MAKNDTRLGFTLWKRKITNRIKSKSNLYFRAITSYGGVISTFCGLYLAYTANNLARQGNEYSQTALMLAKNDTSQQAQLKRFGDIINNQKQQIDTLIEITNELKQLNNSSTNQVEQLTHQTDLLSDNAKPLLKDIAFRIMPKNNQDFTKEIEFIFTVKNFGQRPAYNLTISAIFLKLKGLSIE